MVEEEDGVAAEEEVVAVAGRGDECLQPLYICALCTAFFVFHSENILMLICLNFVH